MEAFKKEILLAVVIGIAIGIVTTLGFTDSFKKISLSIPFKALPSVEMPTSGPTNLSPTFTPSFLTIISPSNEEVLTTPSARIIGKTRPNLGVLIFTEVEETVATSDNDGRFEKEVPLVPGNNQVFISTISESGEEISKDLTLFYFP